MTDQLSHVEVAPKKKRRVFRWVFLAVQVLFLLWAISAGASASGQDGDCQYLSAEACNDASDAGAAIAVGIIIFLWVAVDVVLGITYAVMRWTRKEGAR